MRETEHPIEFLKADGESCRIANIEESVMQGLSPKEVIIGGVGLFMENEGGFDGARQTAKREGIVKVRIEALDFEMEINQAIDAAEQDLHEHMRQERAKNIKDQPEP